MLLAGATVCSVLLTSCSNDDNEPAITYDQTIGITAAHLFDDYEPFIAGDFDMNDDGWKLNLQVLVYNDKGELVDRGEKLCTSMSETFSYSPALTAGKYTVVSIADFRDGLGGSGYKYWNISNEANLQDLTIQENESYYPTPFETLGIDVQSLTVTDRPASINADIKPTTCLVNVFMSDGDYSGWGINGYSRFCVLTDGYFIRAIKAKNTVRFENGQPSFKYKEQDSDYNLAISETHAKWDERRGKTSWNYRALLPEENKGFKFHIQKRDLAQEYYDTFVQFCGEFDTDGVSEVLPEVKSNKQYVVNMILDSFQLVAMEYPANYRHEDYTSAHVADYNRQLMQKMVDTKYENLLSKTESFANTFLDVKPTSYRSDKVPYLCYYPRSRADHFEQFVTTGYLNSDFSNCMTVQLLLPALSDKQFEMLKSMANERFAAEEEGLYGPNNYTYLQKGIPSEDSRYRVVLEKATYDDKYVYFMHYVLRDKFYNQAVRKAPDTTRSTPDFSR